MPPATTPTIPSTPSLDAACVTAGDTSGTYAFLCQAYEDLLGRLPDASGLSTFGGLLNAGFSRTQVAYDLATSGEYRADFVEAVFKYYLGRPADSTGLATFNRLLNAGTSDQQVIADVVGSPEFVGDAGGTNTEFVDRLYDKGLGRTPDAAGLATFVGELNSGTSPLTVARAVFSSGEYTTDTVNFYFRYLLGRGADATGLATFTGLLNAGGTVEQFTSNVMGSIEFGNGIGS